MAASQGEVSWETHTVSKVLLVYGVGKQNLAVQISHQRFAYSTSFANTRIDTVAMSSLLLYLSFILVDVLCISIGIFPHIPGSMCWALWSLLTSRSFSTTSISPRRLEAAKRVMIICSYVAWALHLVFNKDECLFVLLTVAQCLLAAGQMSGLLATHLFRQAPTVIKCMAMLVVVLFLYSAYRAMPLWVYCQKKVRKQAPLSPCMRFSLATASDMQ